MKSVADSAVLERLIERLGALGPETPRRWGSLTAAEMLCHLADATASVLTSTTSEPVPRRPLLKWFALRVPLAWPHGLQTPPEVDPHVEGTRPSDFETDRQRAIDGLRAFAAAPASALSVSHGAFGKMSQRDWQIWAYRHTDHHLRQFGV